jgi:fibro-slime domain-containing protein
MRSLSGLSHFVLVGIFMAAVNGFAQEPDSLVIPVKLRDIRECIGNGPASTCSVNSQPDFQHVASCGDVGYVETNIATDRAVDTLLFPNDNRSPVKSAKLSSTAGVKCYTSIPRFEDWFNDKTGAVGSPEDINRPFLKNLVLHKEAAAGGQYVYDNAAFFPLDTIPSLTKLHPTDPDPYGPLQTAPNNTHTYGFTLEFHATFTYFKDSNQVFTFRGDDDVWVFINGKLVIDLGGRHIPQAQTVNMNDLGLTDRTAYPLDFFFAERHTTQSNCRITTSLQLTAEEEASLVFTDVDGKALQPNQYWSPKDKLFLVYKDDYRKDVPKSATIIVKNNKGTSKADTEVVDLGVPTPDKNTGTWRVEVKLGESTNATANNGTIESYILGEMTATVKSHTVKGQPDGNQVSAQARLAYPDKPALDSLWSDTGLVDRYTKDINLEVRDQSYSKFVDTVYAQMRCNTTGDVIISVPAVETGAETGVYRVIIVKDEAGSKIDGDKILQCQISDEAVSKYHDQVYDTPAVDARVAWTTSGPTTFKYTLKAGDLSTAVASVKDGENNTFFIYVKITDPNIHAQDKLHVTLTTSNATSDHETIELTETGLATGIFVSAGIPYAYGNAQPTNDDKKIEAMFDPTGATNTVTVTGVVTEEPAVKGTLALQSSFDQVVKAWIKDENGDGQADHIYVEFQNPIPAAPATVSAHWNDVGLTQAGAPDITIKPGNNKVLVLDYTAHPFPYGLTGIPAGGHPTVDLPEGSIFNGQKPPLIDSIGPVIRSAVINGYNPATPKTDPSAGGMDTITLVVSEPLRTQTDLNSLLFYSKVEEGKACPAYDGNARKVTDIASVEVDPDGVTYHVLVPISADAPVAKDCLYLTADGTYSDKLLNVAPKHGSLSTGTPPPPVVNIQGYPAVVGCRPTDACFGVSNSDPKDGTHFVQSHGNGVTLPVFLPAGYAPDAQGRQFNESFPAFDTPPSGTENNPGTELPDSLAAVQVVTIGKYLVNVSVFDHIGNFVNSWQQTFGFHGELYNNNRNVPGRGLVSYIVWNLKDKKGQRAGQGVYVWKMVFRFEGNRQEIRYTRTGVMRVPRP